MKHKFFILSTIAVFTIVGLLIFDFLNLPSATSAQRPDRNPQPGQGERGQRQGGERGNRSMGMGNPTSLVDNSWLDLTFNVKVDDETLVKARPVYQATREKFEKKMNEIRESGDFRTAREQMTTFTATTSTAFQKSLKEILSKEDMAKLTELTKERLLARQEVLNRFRGRGGEGFQRGGGGQGGQRGTR